MSIGLTKSPRYAHIRALQKGVIATGGTKPRGTGNDLMTALLARAAPPAAKRKPEAAQ